jgi:hypothetical protein
MSEQDARDAHAAGEQASADRQDHYHQNVMGQAACAGDPMPAESALQPVAPNSQPDDPDPGPVAAL